MRTKLSLAFLSVALVLVAGCGTSPTKSVFTEMTCEQHETVALSFNSFAAHVFDTGYANVADPAMATAQLFLIKNGGPDDYSIKINTAERGYKDNLIAATRSGCDTSDFAISPISEFERRSNALVTAKKIP